MNAAQITPLFNFKVYEKLKRHGINRAVTLPDLITYRLSE